MLLKHSTEQREAQREASGQGEREGIVVPLDLGAFHIRKQQAQEDGSIEVEVIATTDRARCPHCQCVCVKVHDTRPRRKRDLPLRGHRVVLVLLKRRFRCLRCRRSFTEPDQACSRGRRTTKRLREYLGKQACRRPVSHVVAEMQVGPRLVQSCWEEVAQVELAKRHLSLDESTSLPTSRYLGIDEFARRKGHRYDTILCDLDAREVLEVSHLLERLSDCDGVEAVSMDMSTTFREAVQLTLPHACIVADHFHVILHVGKALKKVIARHAKKEPRKQALEGQRHLFLRNQQDLSAEEEQSRAVLALAFPEIASAWQLKEALRSWYASTSAATAARDLDPGSAMSKGRDPRRCAQPCLPFATGGRRFSRFLTICRRV
jgi:transposase